MRARPFQKCMAANANSSAFTAKTAATLTRPSGNLVLPLTDSQSGRVPHLARIFPYGLGANNDAFSMRIWGWRRTNAGLYVPGLLGEFTCIMGNFTGATGGDVLATEFFCDTLALVANDGEPTITAATTRQGTAWLYSPQNDTPGYVEIDIGANELLEFDWDQTTNTPTMNGLITFRDPYLD